MKKARSTEAELSTLSSSEVCAYLKVGPKTLYTLMKFHGLPFWRVGSRYRFNLTALEGWAREQEEKLAARRAHG